MIFAIHHTTTHSLYWVLASYYLINSWKWRKWVHMPWKWGLVEFPNTLANKPTTALRQERKRDKWTTSVLVHINNRESSCPTFFSIFASHRTPHFLNMQWMNSQYISGCISISAKIMSCLCTCHFCMPLTFTVIYKRVSKNKVTNPLMPRTLFWRPHMHGTCVASNTYQTFMQSPLAPCSSMVPRLVSKPRRNWCQVSVPKGRQFASS